MGFNLRTRILINRFISHGNITLAATEAGYSPKTAAKQGSDILKKPEVKAEVERRLKQRLDKMNLKAEDVLKLVKDLAYADITEAFDENGKLLPFSAMPDEVRKMIRGMDTEELFGGRGSSKRKIGVGKKIRFDTRKDYVEILCKYFKILVDAHEHSFKGGNAVVLLLPQNGSESPVAAASAATSSPAQTQQPEPEKKANGA